MIVAKRNLITKNRSDFVYTLEDDEKKCLASIEKINERVREKSVKRGSFDRPHR
jgi:predicted KAP-like P-loop ATPase